MKGIYLSEQGKKEIEAKIVEIEKLKNDTQATLEWNEAVVMINVYKKILLSATILPVEESWNKVDEKSDYGLSSEEFYPQGVIIQTKQ
jgi:hypothetical protein